MNSNTDENTAARVGAPARLAEPTAAEAYAARRGDIARLLDVLGMELDKHDAGAKASPRDWGFAGSLGKVRDDLVNTVAFLSNLDPGDVERFLRDAD